jgi:hypothetical protein
MYNTNKCRETHNHMQAPVVLYMGQIIWPFPKLLFLTTWQHVRSVAVSSELHIQETFERNAFSKFEHLKQ